MEDYGFVTFKERIMRIVFSCLAIILIFMVGGCVAEITGTVVDAETGNSIEGAVILVEWTMTKGVPGMSHTKPFEIEEVSSKRDGVFRIKKLFNPLLNPPRMTIYKKGYVAWNSEYVFPTWSKRKNYEMKDGMFIRLESFKNEYSRMDHVNFLNVVTHWGKLMNEAYRWEELEKEQKR
jgi:hypothetical protein